MQKKKINTILIVAVTLIWGVLIVRFALPYFSEVPQVVTSEVLAVRPMELSYKKDTLVLQMLTRDPFLGKTTAPKRTTVAKSVKKRPKTASKTKHIIWPKVKYFGFVKSKERKNSRLGLVRVDGKLLRVREQQKINETVKITKITQDSIGLSLDNTVKYFKRN